MLTWNKYLAFVHIGLVRAATERGELYGRLLFLPMILGVFTALWGAVGESGMPIDSAPHELVWYLAATEWIALSVPLVYLEVQEDVRRGDIASQLPRPVSYIGAVFCQALGMLIVRASVFGVAVYAWAFLLTGELPAFTALLWLLPFGFGATVLLLAIYVLLGLASFWVDDVSPLYWICQKALFIMGGLMLPLEFYPDWFRQLSAFTPFPSLLSGPARLLSAATPSSQALVLAPSLLLWHALTALAAHLVFQRATRRLQINGG